MISEGSPLLSFKGMSIQAEGSRGISAFSEDELNQRTLLSGVLLNHCSIYRGFKISTAPTPHIAEDLDGVAFICYRFPLNEPMTCEYISSREVQDFLAQQVSAAPSPIWIHVVNPTFIQNILHTYSVESRMSAFLTDKSLRSGWNSVDGSEISVALTNVCLDDDILYAIKFSVVLKSSFVITFEQRVHALPGPESDSVEQEPYFQSAKEFEKKSAILERGGRMRRASSCVSSDGDTIIVSFLFRKMVRKLKDLAIGGKNIQITVLDIFRDLCILMAEGSAPALKIVADHQSVLHDEVFVKFNKPNHSFGAELMKEVRMLQSSLNFFRIMLEMSRHVLDSAEQRLLDFNEKVTSSTFREIRAQFDFSLLSVNALGDELNKIDTSLRDSINHRNNKVSLALSIAATIFLPLNFLTGIFGMNFSNGGLLVMVLSQDNGTDIFYALSIFWILLTLVSLYALGFLEMLTEKETNKKGLARVFNFHRLQEKGILDT